jgi:hypothetical protein
VSAGEIEVGARPEPTRTKAAVEASTPWRIAWGRFRITIFTGTMIIVLNLLVDIVAVILDPRIGRSPRSGSGAFGLTARAT